MKKYRVAMIDHHNGQAFTFACIYHAYNADSAMDQAEKEWSIPTSKITSVTVKEV
ncbi:hypothetical protein [Pseudomonas phage Astolliot]|nr:hypothetical protein [Pseudomonas phage Astolliot]